MPDYKLSPLQPVFAFTEPKKVEKCQRYALLKLRKKFRISHYFHAYSFPYIISKDLKPFPQLLPPNFILSDIINSWYFTVYPFILMEFLIWKVFMFLDPKKADL